MSAAAVVLSLAFGSLARLCPRAARLQGQARGVVLRHGADEHSPAVGAVPTFTLLASIGLTEQPHRAGSAPHGLPAPHRRVAALRLFRHDPGRTGARGADRRLLPLGDAAQGRPALSGPGLVAAGLFVLTFAWNDFVVAVVMTSGATPRPSRSRSTAISVFTAATGARSPRRRSSRSSPSSPSSSSFSDIF